MKFILNKTFILVVALISVWLGACKKSERSVPEPTISINILSPTQGAVLRQGDTLHIKADITSPVELHGYSWRIINEKTGTELASDEAHAHGKSISVSGYWINTLNEDTKATLEVKAEVNHEGNEKVTNVSFSCDN